MIIDPPNLRVIARSGKLVADITAHDQAPSLFAGPRPLTERGISVILPAWNEEANIEDTVYAVIGTLQYVAPNFEVIVVDDGSTDRTSEIADALAATDARVRVIHNRPNRGYGGALAAGFAAAEKELLFFMDSDGQFDINDIQRLILPYEAGDAEVILGYRAHRADPPLRKLNALAWKRLVSLLFGLQVRDIDCAFKLIPTRLMRTAAVESTGAMINTEFLAKFARMGVTMHQVPVNHYPRAKGTATGANIGVIFRAFRELFGLAQKLRTWSPDASDDDRNPPMTPNQATLTESYRACLTHRAMVRSTAYSQPTRPLPVPMDVNETRIQTFSTLPKRFSAVQTLTRPQAIVLVTLVLGWAAGLALWGAPLLIGTVAAVTLVYLSDLLITTWLAARTLNHSPEIHVDDVVVNALAGAAWPSYTILCPLYRETEVVPQFLGAMRALDYPADKLEILFLTEADDQATRLALLAMDLPPHFQVVTVPDGELRTKPRACNYGLLRAKGEYVVIYDAEDIPDPLQLKKAVLAFANYGEDLACVQAKLNFYNPHQNLLTP